ncbi:hypothetical protein A2774_00655 [Candidatus Roizmanbacteria bacterium RIFCSPHIGHO2_01_FULL_39_12c]|uniref:Uncharacterized protein n=1 Tax=Candidatus Roizmanbacteria bacterium RIFCSPHIGHO2_01_FULL_39_12c TaxID=1802031 RepID=A0A1F7GA11_9BACT|nr:MAG: hypothetical protein A2774_00655 [Candidatus Roizmanbacteria bacterium RIFCSPHIGHO2_01_FULL_39_12c]OGK47380.1 MAG: hypothetical protein A2963_04575 [Candidatus Roizmanbacteria bacterium RIFCSPLOWO2_01_FULL_40_13]
MVGRFKSPPHGEFQRTQKDMAQLAMEEVVSAFIGSGMGRDPAEKVVLSAAGDSMTPDGVSRAVRSRISPKLMKKLTSPKK